MKAFITDSRAYGTPHADSDIDLVVLMDKDDALRLADLADSEAPLSVASDTGFSLRFGKLNLLIETGVGEFEDWLTGTNQLKAKAPVKRSVAVELFDRLRERRQELNSESDIATLEAEYVGFGERLVA